MTSAQPGTRWGVGQRTEGEIARARILDAAGICFQRHGIARTRAVDIAVEARVTRSTFYRYFSSVDEVGPAVMVRAFQELWLRMRDELNRSPDMAHWLQDCFVFAVLIAPRRRRHRLLFLPGAVDLLRRELLCNDKALMQHAEWLCQQYQWRHGAPHHGMIHVADWFCRLLISFWMNPGPKRSARRLRQLAGALFPPRLVHRRAGNEHGSVQE